MGVGHRELVASSPLPFTVRLKCFCPLPGYLFMGARMELQSQAQTTQGAML